MDIAIAIVAVVASVTCSLLAAAALVLALGWLEKEDR